MGEKAKISPKFRVLLPFIMYYFKVIKISNALAPSGILCQKQKLFCLMKNFHRIVLWFFLDFGEKYFLYPYRRDTKQDIPFRGPIRISEKLLRQTKTIVPFTSFLFSRKRTKDKLILSYY